MPNIRYLLFKKKANKKGLAPIVANVSIDYTNVTKVVAKIKPKYWNPNPRPKDGIAQWVRQPRPDEPDNEYKIINAELDKLTKDANNFFNECNKYNIKVTPEIVRDFFDGKRVKLGPKTFWEAVDAYLEFVKIEQEKSTSRTKKTFFNFLKEFQNQTGYQISFSTINLEFFDKYRYYVLETCKKHWNYLAVQTRILKAFLIWASERKYYHGQEHKNFKVPEKDSTVVILTYDELMKLYNFELEELNYQKVRDIFCFGCFTGLRISDVLKLNKEHIHDGTITLIVQKTKKKLEIPILPETQTIIDRYSDQYMLLPQFREQTINEYIKKACKIVGIDNPTKIKSHPKGEMQEATFPKYQLIHTHTARKTFISVAYKLNMDIEMIKDITGITQEATLKKYLTIDINTKRERMLKAWAKKDLTEDSSFHS